MGAFLTRLATETSHVTTCCSSFFWWNGSLVQRTEGEECVCSVQEQIEKSKSLWSQVVEFDSDEEVAEVSNVKVFKALQGHPTWGGFFYTFGEEGYGELVMGTKFAEGGQAELYEAQIEWYDLQKRELTLKAQVKFVLKVFKKGTFLRHLQSHWPEEMLQNHVEEVKHAKLGLPLLPQFHCDIICGTLLEDGRFAFVLVKEQEDLRSRIDCHMLATPKSQWTILKTRG